MASEMAAGADSARVVHHVRGRMRLRFDRDVNVSSAADRLRSSLAEHPGVQTIEPHPRTHSVVVRYDAAVMDIQRLLDEGFPAAAVEILDTGVGAIARIASGTAVGKSVVRAVGTANSRLDHATGGVLDLRDVMPLALFGLGIRRLIQAGAEPVPWYNLIYWGFSTFSILHGDTPALPRPPEPDALEILRQRFARGEISRAEFREKLAELRATAEAVEPEATSESGEPAPGGAGSEPTEQ